MKDKSPLMLVWLSQLNLFKSFFFLIYLNLTNFFKGIHSLILQEHFLNPCWGQVLKWLPEGRARDAWVVRKVFTEEEHEPNQFLNFLFVCLFKQSITCKSFEKPNTAKRLTTENSSLGASLVAQWLRIHLPMQGTRVWALVQEDSTCRGATKPMCYNYWACAPEPTSHNYWAYAPRACAPQQEKPLQWEARAPQGRVAPARLK